MPEEFEFRFFWLKFCDGRLFVRFFCVLSIVRRTHTMAPRSHARTQFSLSICGFDAVTKTKTATTFRLYAAGSDRPRVWWSRSLEDQNHSQREPKLFWERPTTVRLPACRRLLAPNPRPRPRPLL